MSLETLFSKTATVVAMGSEGTDVYNNPTRAEESRSDYPAHVEQTTAVEIQIGRDTIISNWLGVLGRNEEGNLPTITAFDQIVVDGVTYEVVGPPNYVEEPGMGTHHVELRMRYAK